MAAIVLFDWLMEVDLETVPITHRAQKQALSDLLGAFEWRMNADITSVTQEEITAAQEVVAKNMNW